MISEVFFGDNLEYMKGLPDGFFDIAVDNPPYFSGPEKRRFYGRAKSNINVRRVNYEPLLETWTVPQAGYYNELLRVSKHQIIWGINYFPEFQNVPTGRIVWDKCNDASSFSDCEIASCSLIKTVKIFRFMWNGMLQGKSIEQGHLMQGNKKLNEKRIHQCQKPVSLYKWSYKNFAEPSWKIFDPHCGSQSSRIAAYDMGYDYYGCEKSEIAYLSGNKRFDLFKSQTKLAL